MTIEKILDWAWINGLNVSIYSRSSYADSEYFNPRRESPNFIEHGQFVIHIPCIRFSRNDKYIEVTARNWAEMKEQLKYKHKHIFSELMCKPLE